MGVGYLDPLDEPVEGVVQVLTGRVHHHGHLLLQGDGVTTTRGGVGRGGEEKSI